MALTMEEILEEAQHLPRQQMIELVDRLAERLQIVPEIESAWRAETRRRVAEIEGGSVKGIPGEEVSARIRKIVGR